METIITKNQLKWTGGAGTNNGERGPWPVAIA